MGKNDNNLKFLLQAGRRQSPGSSPLDGGGGVALPAPLGSRMDGATHPPLLPIPGGGSLQLTGLHLTRCAHQASPLSWVSPVSPSGISNPTSLTHHL
jgi:hypothetical protein